jgi:predicted aspartyl protease
MSQPLVSRHFPYLPLQLEILGRTHTLEALIDTGFDGSLALPEQLFRAGEPPDGTIPCTLADGTTLAVNYYRGIVALNHLGRFRVMVLALGDEPLIGRGIIDRFSVTLDHGRRIVVEP